MLPEVRLDTGSFEEIAREGRNLIGGIYPEWTDYNYHDPGITFLELFAFLKEAQQFHMDQIGDRHKKKFLKLLGIIRRGRRPARMMASMDADLPLLLREGSRFRAGDMIFETAEDEYLPGVHVTGMRAREISGRRFSVDMGKREQSGGLMIYPFGRQPKPGNEWQLRLDGPLEPGRDIHMGIRLYDGYEVKRNPIEEGRGFYPLAEISLEYTRGNGYGKARVKKDETWGLIRSGRICFSVGEEMEPWEESGERGYYLKIRLEKGRYDTAPVVCEASLSHLRVVQQETKASWKKGEPAKDGPYRADRYEKTAEGFRLLGDGEPGGKGRGEIWSACYLGEFYPKRILGVGDGFPDQRFLVPAQGFMADGFRILVESLVTPGVFEVWEQREDFDRAGPEDRVFAADEETGEILFGNGWNGMVPEREIRIVECFCTRGSAGNIKAGKEIFPEGREESPCIILEDGQGGSEGETMAQCETRAVREMKDPGRAVTEADYERLVQRTPGLRIQAVKVLKTGGEGNGPEDHVVHVAVRPFCDMGEGVLSAAYRENILAFLEEKRLLGTRVSLCSPEYTEIGVYVEISAKPGYLKIREQVEEEIRGFFKKLEGIFGPFISRGSLYARLDQLEGVKKIHMLSIEARGNRVARSIRGDVRLPPAGVLLLKEQECIVVNN